MCIVSRHAFYCLAEVGSNVVDGMRACVAGFRLSDGSAVMVLDSRPRVETGVRHKTWPCGHRTAPGWFHMMNHRVKIGRGAFNGTAGQGRELAAHRCRRGQGPGDQEAACQCLNLQLSLNAHLKLKMFDFGA